MKKMLGVAAAVAVALPIIAPAVAMADDDSGSMQQPMSQDPWGWTEVFGHTGVGLSQASMATVQGLGLGSLSGTGASPLGSNVYDEDPNMYSMGLYTNQ